MGRGLGQPHGHPEPPVFSPVGGERRVIRGLLLEDYVVEACFEVQHADLLGPAEPGPIPLSVIQLVLVLLSAIVYRDNVLYYPVRLSQLLAGY